MNSRQMQYAVLLAETGSFSQLAEKLKLSQPALSKQILSLEKELEVQLFDRTTTPVTLTAAGAHFVREARELLHRENQLLRSMAQFRSGERGQLVIGTTPFRSAYLLPPVVQKVREKFPGIHVRLVEEGSELLRKDAADGKFDFAVVNLPVDEAVLDTVPMEPDQLVLVVPNRLLSGAAALQNAAQADFRDCAQLPFVVVSPQQEMRILFEKLCAQSDILPNIAAEVVGLTTAWEMVCSGVAATLLPLQFVRQVVNDHPVTILRLCQEVSLRQPAVAVRRGQYLSPAAQYAISLLEGRS